MCGAENKTATVVIIVKVVKMMRQNLKAKKSLIKLEKKENLILDHLSITMAANFQSDSISFSLSIVFKRPVIKRSSYRDFSGDCFNIGDCYCSQIYSYLYGIKGLLKLNKCQREI